MANGMGSLYIGVSGLQSAQTALNTTAHNLSNINSTGYTRQQTSFATATYLPIGSGLSTKQYGLGVKIEDIRRVRNEFVDDAYRSSNGRLGYYKSQYEAVEEVEELFGELQGVTYQESLNNLKEAINELSKNPTSTTARTSVIQQATAFMTRSDTIYQQLNDYQTTLNAQVSNLVDKINSLGDEIKDLNKRILGSYVFHDSNLFLTNCNTNGNGITDQENSDQQQDHDHSHRYIGNNTVNGTKSLGSLLRLINLSYIIQCLDVGNQLRLFLNVVHVHTVVG